MKNCFRAHFAVLCGVWVPVPLIVGCVISDMSLLELVVKCMYTWGFSFSIWFVKETRKEDGEWKGENERLKWVNWIIFLAVCLKRFHLAGANDVEYGVWACGRVGVWACGGFRSLIGSIKVFWANSFNLWCNDGNNSAFTNIMNI